MEIMPDAEDGDILTDAYVSGAQATLFDKGKQITGSSEATEDFHGKLLNHAQ